MLENSNIIASNRRPGDRRIPSAGGTGEALTSERQQERSGILHASVGEQRSGIQKKHREVSRHHRRSKVPRHGIVTSYRDHAQRPRNKGRRIARFGRPVHASPHTAQIRQSQLGTRKGHHRMQHAAKRVVQDVCIVHPRRMKDYAPPRQPRGRERQAGILHGQPVDVTIALSRQRIPASTEHGIHPSRAQQLHQAPTEATRADEDHTHAAIYREHASNARATFLSCLSTTPVNPCSVCSRRAPEAMLR